MPHTSLKASVSGASFLGSPHLAYFPPSSLLSNLKPPEVSRNRRFRDTFSEQKRVLAKIIGQRNLLLNLREVPQSVSEYFILIICKTFQMSRAP
jgi:hypothetical protein